MEREEGPERRNRGGRGPFSAPDSIHVRLTCVSGSRLRERGRVREGERRAVMRNVQIFQRNRKRPRTGRSLTKTVSLRTVGESPYSEIVATEYRRNGAWQRARKKNRRGSGVKRTLGREIALIGEEQFVKQKITFSRRRLSRITSGNVRDTRLK